MSRGAQESHGPSKREREVLDLLDKGLSRNQIAEETGLARSTVDSVVSRLATAGCGASWEPAARKSSRKLLEALRTHHPEMCQ